MLETVRRYLARFLEPSSKLGPAPTDSRFAATMFVVEADSYSRLMLWKEFHEKHKWEQDCNGLALTVAWLGEMPVVVEFFWISIDSQRVLFCYPVSSVVDWEAVERWLRLYCNPKWDRGARRAHCDAMNFHHCLHAIEEARSGRKGVVS